MSGLVGAFGAERRIAVSGIVAVAKVEGAIVAVGNGCGRNGCAANCQDNVKKSRPN